jgi:hypothetical protein
MGKGKDPDPDPDPYLWLTDPRIREAQKLGIQMRIRNIARKSLEKNRTKNLCSRQQQCSGSVSFWASRIQIRIHNYLFGSGSGSFYQVSIKTDKKTLISTVQWLLNDWMWICLNTVVNIPTVRTESDQQKIKTIKKYFLLASRKPLTKISGSGSVIQCLDPKIRISLNMSLSRIRNTARQSVFLQIRIKTVLKIVVNF